MGSKKFLTSDELYMVRALELAVLGKGSVSPNPLVGCVVVHDGVIIGEGWHQKYGEAHAEVNAVNAVKDKDLLKHSTAYVTLEPCSHTGKTPPCADMLIRHQVKKVVICNHDSNPLVAGKGIKKLEDAGIAVVTGILESQGRELNKRFFTWMEKRRPYIILKWAETADGFIARESFDSKWISDGFSRQVVHQWRAEEDAILVGFGTALHDNPQLNVRDWAGRNPIRVVIDKDLQLQSNLHLFDGSQKTLCYNFLRDDVNNDIAYVRVDRQNYVSEILADLFSRKIQSMIVEGGAKTLQAFIDAGLWDEARVFVSHQNFEKGISAPRLDSAMCQQKLKSDFLRIYHRL